MILVYLIQGFLMLNISIKTISAPTRCDFADLSFFIFQKPHLAYWLNRGK
jgi:hypothetical protein